ncbi:MAG: ACP S-malonyltransferase [Elusimicrobia bacterium]|nr:ACP S-malonyltransferase [Elusimicrobiota bacterium]
MAETFCVMFAGQSVQEAGMGRQLLKIPAARKVIERLIPRLGEDLPALLTDTPDAALALTLNAQRAIHASHLAHFLAYKAAHPELRLDGAIGHSMGIVAALVAAEAMSVEDSGAFIRARAEAFSKVCKSFGEPMGLAAVSTEDFGEVFEAAAEVPGVSVALHNTIGRGTIGGSTAALEAFVRKAREEDWPVKVTLLKVEGPYHTKAFSPCKAALQAALARIEVRPPRVPVFMGTSGRAENDPARIKALLAEQADSPELHHSAVRAAYAAGCRRFLEIARKPQPVTWLADQLRAQDGQPYPDVTALAVTTEQLSG